MPAACVVFCDLVEFSNRPAQRQRYLVNSLANEVVYSIREQLSSSGEVPSAVALPTGDGIALVLFNPEEGEWTLERVMSLVVRLFRWAERESTTDDGHIDTVQLRIGMNEGSVDIVYDVNGRVNVCGNAVNLAQRLMDAANPSQLLLSESFVGRYFGGISQESSASREFRVDRSQRLRAKAIGPTYVTVKHGVRLAAFRVQFENPPFPYDDSEPAAAKNLVVKLTTTGKPLDDFCRKLEGARSIALIQLTGYRLVERFESGSIQLRDDLERFWVFMPDRTEASPRYAHLGLTEDRVGSAIAKWSGLLSQFATKQKYADIHFGLFAEPPYFGASYVDWQAPGGQIHVSPYVWGEEPVNCPGFDLEWSGVQEPPVFRVYVRTLNYLKSTYRNSQ